MSGYGDGAGQIGGDMLEVSDEGAPNAAQWIEKVQRLAAEAREVIEQARATPSVYSDITSIQLREVTDQLDETVRGLRHEQDLRRT